MALRQSGTGNHDAGRNVARLTRKRPARAIFGTKPRETRGAARTIKSPQTPVMTACAHKGPVPPRAGAIKLVVTIAAARNPDVFNGNGCLQERRLKSWHYLFEYSVAHSAG